MSLLTSVPLQKYPLGYLDSWLEFTVEIYMFISISASVFVFFHLASFLGKHQVFVCT